MNEPYEIPKNIFDKFLKCDQWRRFLDAYERSEGQITVSGLTGPAKLYVAAAVTLSLSKPVTYITPDHKTAETASTNLSFFLGRDVPVLRKREVQSKTALFTSSSQSLTDRAGWLSAATGGGTLVAEAGALRERLVPVRIFEESKIRIGTGDLFLREELIERLAACGYRKTDFVEREGEMSVRGSIVDVFMPGRTDAARIEFLGDEIGSIRMFDTGNQKSKNKISGIIIPPASEIILRSGDISRAIPYLKKKAEEIGVTARKKAALISEIGKGERIRNIEWLTPALYEDTSSVFDYLPAESVLILDESEDVSGAQSVAETENRDFEKSLSREIDIAPGTRELFFPAAETERRLNESGAVRFDYLELDGGAKDIIRLNSGPADLGTRENESTIDAIVRNIRDVEESGYEAHLVFKTAGERDKFIEILAGHDIGNPHTCLGNLTRGFKLEQAKLSVFTERELIGETKKRKTRRKSSDAPSAFITSFSELKPGDFIVHVDFGIGIFRSLKRLRIGDTDGDFILCEYAGGDRIYVPVDKLKMVQRYIGDGKKPRVDRLGNQAWGKRVGRVRKAVQAVAKELLDLYAKRKTRKGFSFSPSNEMYREFELSFPFDETPDQESAINDVMEDMESDMPMDRLICGDVGFGKTEVALRAAFKAVLDGKQVAFLVPTTLLAHQHYKTSRERLKGYPVMVDILSRFKTRKEESETLRKLEEGKVDLIIGTHKLLGNRVKFRDIGLLINDEEHRFGVSQKEKLKKIREDVDSLSLSATPIPRTLQLSLAKIRDISLINTPPKGRQSIETYVYRSDPGIIKEAIAKELKRGGSVFFIHNRIEDIHRVADRVRKLAPEAAIAVTHGRMREKELEHAVQGFMEGEIDILVTTAIVESGLDIPRANTIIIDDSHTFGLADLYQLRGRVGRSDKKAYAYFLIPSSGSITPEARRRLKAISEFTELGSGFKLALSDLEIRGAGHLFGSEQSGHITDIGLELYLDMLEAAVSRLEGREEKEEVEPEISAHTPAFIPDDYIASDSERLLFYKRLSSAKTTGELDEIRDELNDRFGKIPPPLENLTELVMLKLAARRIGAEKADVGSKKAVIIFSENSAMRLKYPPDGKMEIHYDGGNPVSETTRILENMTA